MKQNLLLFAVALALFFAGRFTAPVKEVEDTHKVDSLTRDIRAKERKLAATLDSVNHYRILSETWFKQAQESQKPKIVFRTIFNHEKQHIDSLSVPELDSAFAKRYGRLN